MDSDQGKLFLGGISWETDEEKLRDYFGNYGEVSQAVVMRDKLTGRPRGFGFVVFADPSVVDRVLESDRHVIDGRAVEVKRALSREEQGSKVGNSGGSGNYGGSGGNTRTKKIFVGGLPPTLDEEGFRQYFEAYGTVTDVVIMYDQQTNRPRGFGFVSFDAEDAVDNVLHKTFHDLNGKQVEVKRALPKDANPGSSGRSGGGYQGYGNLNSYEGRMDSNRRYSPPQNASNYPPGYNTPGYGHSPSNGLEYGFGNYGSASYGGPIAGGYASPNAGFGGPPPNALRSSWGSQAPTGYGYGGGGNAGQGYSYGGYGGSEGGYGAVGGRVGGGGVPSGDGGYGDGSGNAGYGNSSWQSQGSGYYGGGGYGGVQTRPAPQQ